MFDISGSHIAQLNDADLRRLVALLCEAELRRGDLSLSAVSAGGAQEAKDGGVDVRVDLPGGASISGFIPRGATGFQVKVPDMPPQKIRAEMAPEGSLRPAIEELADSSGAYVIVSAKGSVSYSALKGRRQAMRAAVSHLPNADVLFLDFYDRERLATWVRDHAGLVTWVRERIGQPIQGWRPYGGWTRGEAPDAEYLLDDKCRLHDWRSSREGGLTAEHGILRIREILATPHGTVRLVGLSGTGKTRLVQALFDNRISGTSLAPTQAVYTDLADEPHPSPRELVFQLIQNRQRAFVVVDNCPPETHRALADKCQLPESRLSLITVEYDVGEDEPEGTEVFRLEPASADVVEKILKRRYPKISSVDRRRIADFSGGNARIALVLTHTLKRGESVANLTDKVLFERLFHQRQTRDRTLLRAAEACSLVYSFDGETLEGEAAELPTLAALAGVTVDDLYRCIAELKSRDLLQRRSRWRALLPHAVANRLAREALEGNPPGKIADAMLNQPSGRLLRSFSRRLGFLHDCEAARALVESWLVEGGLLGNPQKLNQFGQDMFRNVAPVAPEAVLLALERAAYRQDSGEFLDPSDSGLNRGSWISLLASLAYDPALFHRAAVLLARFATVESSNQRLESAKQPFKQLFYLHLSGTHATIEQRLQLIEFLVASDDPACHSLALDALDGLLEAWHFSSTDDFTFGARPRDYGWQPKTEEEVSSWYRTALDYAKNLVFSRGPLRDKARAVLASNFRGLWVGAGIAKQLDGAVREIAAENFWPKGWIAVRSTIRFDAGKMDTEDVELLRSLEKALRPRDLVEKTRAYVYSESWSGLDVADGELDEEDEGRSSHDLVAEVARQLGREAAVNSAALDELMPDLVRGKVHQGWFFGEGLAEGAAELAGLWSKLVGVLRAVPENERNVQVLRGFLFASANRSDALADTWLDAGVTDPILGYWFPALQTAVEIGEKGAARLETALRHGTAPVSSYHYLAYGCATDSIPPQALRSLLHCLAEQPQGLGVAIHVFSMRLHSDRKKEGPGDSALIQCGRELLHRYTFEEPGQRDDYELSRIVDVCLEGEEAADSAAVVCQNILGSMERHRTHLYEYRTVIASLFRLQPTVALDAFLGAEKVRDIWSVAIDSDRSRANPLKDIPAHTVIAWAQQSPESRFPRLASVVPLFGDTDSNGVSLAMEVLNHAPDRSAILAEFHLLRFFPNAWSGSLADILERRRSLPRMLMGHSDPLVVAWARQMDEDLARTAEQERLRDRQGDESFE